MGKRISYFTAIVRSSFRIKLIFLDFCWLSSGAIIPWNGEESVEISNKKLEPRIC